MQDHDPINLLLRAATTSKQLNSSPNVGSARYYGFSGSAVASILLQNPTLSTAYLLDRL